MCLNHCCNIIASIYSTIHSDWADSKLGLHTKPELLALQGLNKSGGHCATCLFPTYPGLESINVAAYKQIDFSNKWVYFLGDISIRQMYGEFAALVHRAQVRQSPTLSWL